MRKSTWTRLVTQYVEEETNDQDAWRDEWPERLGMAWERVCLQLETDDVHPDYRLNALAYVAAWCMIGARAEEARRMEDFATINPAYGKKRKDARTL